MARPRTIIKTTCQNPDCKYFLKEKGKDILKRGKNRAGHQRYYCNHCNKWFLETTNTPLYHKHLSKSEIILICKHLVEKNGIRSIERITGHHRDTISHLLEDLAVHAEFVNNILLNEVKLGQFEVDEMWTTIKKNRKKLSKEAQKQMKKVMRGSTIA
jgi:transposase-like protein